MKTYIYIPESPNDNRLLIAEMGSICELKYQRKSEKKLQDIQQRRTQLIPRWPSSNPTPTSDPT